MASEERCSVPRWALRILVCAVIAAGLYVGGYVVLMRRDLPAMDRENERLTYRSSFRFAPGVMVCDMTTTLWPAVSPLNVVFLPIDDCWRRWCGFIGAVPENEPFVRGQLDPGRIKEIRVWIYPPGMFLAEKYEDFGRCTPIDVAAGDAAQELCQALAAPHSALTNARGASTVDGTIEAVLDSGGSVFLYFFVYENSEVFVCHPPASPAHDPFANKHGQDNLLPWLRKYAL